jgi:glycosyltransferase involved in cell wall biosynthesis
MPADEIRFDALLEEYRTLRREIENAAQIRLALLAFAASAWAGLAAWITANRKAFYSEPALLVLHVPLIVIYLLLKLAERHTMRVSSYIREFIESEIDGLRWESRVSEFQSRSPFVLSTSQIAAVSLFLLSISTVGLVFLFNIPPLYIRPRWVDFLVFAPFWAWLVFRHFPALISHGSRTSERSAAQLWKIINELGKLPPTEGALRDHPLFIGVPLFNKSSTLVSSLTRIVEEVDAFAPGANVVVYDDGSTDDTILKLRSLESQFMGRVVLLHSSNRKGKSAAMNILADYARYSNAEIICFIDPDVICGSDSIKRLVDCIRSVPEDRIIAPTVLPILEGLTFPLLHVARFKSLTEHDRKLYRPYVNGRAFGLRLLQFPKLLDSLRQCDDRFLTIMFGTSKIAPCDDARFYYYPPSSIWQLFVDRYHHQQRLIRLKKEQPIVYAALRNRRMSFFHTYVFTYPKSVRRHMLSHVDSVTVIALLVERVVLILAKIWAELVFLVSESAEE